MYMFRYLYLSLYIHIYIYIERERHTYIYIYTHMPTYVSYYVLVHELSYFIMSMLFLSGGGRRAGFVSGFRARR